MQDVSRLTRRVKQVAGGWEDRLWIVTDEVMEFETLMPLIQSFDALQSGVALRITHEVLSGTWEALRDGRADVIIGATNAPPAMPKLQWFELGAMEWVFAVSPRHPLAKVKEPLQQELLMPYRAVVVADTARDMQARGYGVFGGQGTLAVPSMRAKILAQRDSLGIGWLPKQRVASLLKRGELVEKRVAGAREPNVLYVAWRSDHQGRALTWWLEQLRQPRLASRLIQGIAVPS
jgi:DNA-binding transcriptional LysR family regulator